MKAMYLRKSRADSPDSTVAEVLAKHRQALEELADRLGIVIDDVYEEVVSGESLRGRPEMLRLLENVKAGKYDAVLCMDIDRLGRGGMADQGVILDAFQSSDTLIVTPEKTYDLSDETDEEMTEFKAFFARREYKMIRKRMRRGLHQTILDGGYTANAPYGYRQVRKGKKPSLEIIEEEAYFVRYMYRRYAEGVGASTIARELNMMGSVPRRLAEWRRSTVRNALRNPTYAGYVAWNRVKRYTVMIDGKEVPRAQYMPEKDWILVEGLHDAIIDRDEWHRVQQLRKDRTLVSTPSREITNPLAGLVFCGNCGNRIQRSSAKNGITHMLCTTTACIAAARFDYVEEQLLADLKGILSRLRVVEAQHQAPDLSALEAAVSASSKDLDKIADRIDRIYSFLEDGTYDKATFKERLEAAENDRKAALDRLKYNEEALASAKEVSIKDVADRIENLLNLYPSLEPAAKNLLLKNVIERVDYYKEKKTKPHDFRLKITLKNFSADFL